MIKYLGIIATLIFLPMAVGAVSADDFLLREAPAGYFYPEQFDALVLDVVIPSGNGENDKLLALTFENEGNARDRNDIQDFILWTDGSSDGFEGLAKDKKVGALKYNSSDHYWYLDNLNLDIPINGLRIFVSAETSESLTDNRSIRMKISELNDVNGNENYNNGDRGVFLESLNNGPQDKPVINPNIQTLKDFSRDNLAPKSVIDNLANGQSLPEGSLLIVGQARDHGGSTPAWVKLSVNDKWYEVESTGPNYATWQYAIDLVEGEYTLKTQSADWLNNVESEGDNLTVSVSAPVVEEEPEEVVEEEAEDEVREYLKNEINRLREQVLELLNQLLTLLLAEL